MPKKAYTRKLGLDDQRAVLSKIKDIFIHDGIWTDHFSEIEKAISRSESILCMTQKRVYELYQEDKLVVVPFQIEDANAMSEYLKFFKKKTQKNEKKEPKTPQHLKEKEEPDTLFLRLNTSKVEDSYFTHVLFCVNHVYERYFAKVKATYLDTKHSEDPKDRIWLRAYDLNLMLRHYKEDNLWLYDVDSTALQNTIRCIDYQWRTYFKRIKYQYTRPEEEREFPELPECGKALTEFMITSSSVSFDEEKGELKLPKLSLPVKAEIVSGFQTSRGKVSCVIISKQNDYWMAKLIIK